jgi:hypothetical protein
MGPAMAGISKAVNASRGAPEELSQKLHEVVTLRRDPADQEMISSSFNTMEVSARPTGWDSALDNVMTPTPRFWRLVRKARDDPSSCSGSPSGDDRREIETADTLPICQRLTHGPIARLD